MNVSLSVLFRRASTRPLVCAHYSSLWLIVNPRQSNYVKHKVIMATTSIASPFGTRRNRNNEIEIPEKRLHIAFIRASGPGGQNVNKVSTAVEVRCDRIINAVLFYLRIVTGACITNKQPRTHARGCCRFAFT